MCNGATVYRGPSLLDGGPIVAIVTGLRHRSRNPKTGKMLQLWILRSDVHPSEALATGADASICGSCVHRPSADRARTCYVNIMGPTSVHRYQRDVGYPDVDPAGLCTGQSVRLGAYGDPGALPSQVLQDLVTDAVGWTGYTHQWRDLDRAYRGYVMASCESAAEARQAKEVGWRVFRVRTPYEPLMAREIGCPASDEGGKRAQCLDCGLCDGVADHGDRRKNIAIVVHGSGKSAYLGAR